jgi:hypothetical protein
MIITAIDPAGKGTTGVMLFCDTQNWISFSKKNDTPYESFCYIRKIIERNNSKIIIIENFLPFRRITNSALSTISMVEAYCCDNNLLFLKYHPNSKIKWKNYSLCYKFKNKHESDAWKIGQEYFLRNGHFIRFNLSD